MPRRVTSVRLSSKGQVVIPAPIRRRVGWSQGQPLRVRVTERGEVVFAPPALSEADVQAALRRAGEWTRRTGRDLVEELHEARRAERARWKARLGDRRP